MRDEKPNGKVRQPRSNECCGSCGADLIHASLCRELPDGRGECLDHSEQRRKAARKAREPLGDGPMLATELREARVALRALADAADERRYRPRDRAEAEALRRALGYFGRTASGERLLDDHLNGRL